MFTKPIFIRKKNLIVCKRLWHTTQASHNIQIKHLFSLFLY